MRVDQLDGDLLDCWVAKCEKAEEKIFHNVDGYTLRWHQKPNKYSSEWQHGGPIIERMHMFISPPNATVHRNGGPHSGWGESGMWTASTKTRGPTGAIALGCDKSSPLIAAMRARVRFEFGDEVPDIEPATTLTKGIV